MPPAPVNRLEQSAVLLAEEWLNLSNELLTREERKLRRRMASLLSHAGDKVFLMEMLDQCFRSSNRKRIGNQIVHLFDRYGIPDFFSPTDKRLIRLFLSLGRYFPDISVPRIIDKLRKDSSHTIIEGQLKKRDAWLLRQKKKGFRVNLNHLGEAVLGEEEARNRLKIYLDDLKNPSVEQISVKISSIYSQVNALAFDHTVKILVNRLSQLYTTAADHYFVDRTGRKSPKFVNLDMESYNDLEITTAAFQKTLDLIEFKNISAGIALQAYLPESFKIQKALTSWAKNRIAGGGSPIKIRIVKGANMEMEKVEAVLKNWPLATYHQKSDTDANYKRMVDFGMQPENITAVSLGIASHNLFDLAYAFKKAEKNNVQELFIFEMLTGMADHVVRAVSSTQNDVLLYAPYTTRLHFINAIAYLVRRLDENSREENFLRHSFHLTPDSPEWRFLKHQFTEACCKKSIVHQNSHRVQNRLTEVLSEQTGTYYTRTFVNEPDTDWSLAVNRQWAETIRNRWKANATFQKINIPVVIGGTEIFDSRPKGECRDPSFYAESAVVARYAIANGDDVAAAVAVAGNDPDNWRKKSIEERHYLLSMVAGEVRRMRGDLIGSAAAGTGKIFTESDVEVSEAVDFLEYYPFSLSQLKMSGSMELTGKGTGVVVSPWNFPIAIPCGGIAAALAAGNTVIFKPSSQAVLPAWLLCQAFWNAGITRNTLQFVPCRGQTTGIALVTHPGVDFVIFTGGTETGLHILKQKPDLYLAGETGGKNATVVTAMADRDQAVKNVVYSAFGNSGQKCSATSLLILEKEVYDDPQFKQMLVDAANSFQTGSAWEFENKMGPLILPPEGDLRRALTQLEEGESWALKPVNISENPHLWTPGIKWDVSPGSCTHMTEFFGPVLAVMRAESLDHALELVNQTGYGLTSGLESLDEREHEIWKSGIRAGNLYINRGTTGAITLRQPFGGMGKSALGAGIKAGGPDYVAQFMDCNERVEPTSSDFKADHPLLKLIEYWRCDLNSLEVNRYASELKKAAGAVKNYLHHMKRTFGEAKDFFKLPGQENILRYLPVGHVVIRLHEMDALFDILARITAARIAGCKMTLSLPASFSSEAMDFLDHRDMENLLGDAKVIHQSDEDLCQMIPRVHRIRYAAPDRIPPVLYQSASETGFYITGTPVLMEGRIELLHYLRNQSICLDYHRYGNLGRRGLRLED